jgi:hypothetical protein
MPDNMWFACLPPSLAAARTALEQNGPRCGSSPAPFFGTRALPLLERAGDLPPRSRSHPRAVRQAARRDGRLYAREP